MQHIRARRSHNINYTSNQNTHDERKLPSNSQHFHKSAPWKKGITRPKTSIAQKENHASN